MQLFRETCSVDGCERKHKARGWCATHYAQFIRTGEVKAFSARSRVGGSCSVDGCGEPVKAKGLCDAHYAHRLRHGHLSYRRRETREPRRCGIAGCDNWLYSRGMCSMHYVQDRNMRLTYGITLDTYHAKAASQDWRCEVCGQPERAVDSRTKKLKQLAVDHDHGTGKFRGILCSHCNRAIGLLGDNISTVEALAAYLRSHQE
jgi:Recombination endonuclease VII